MDHSKGGHDQPVIRVKTSDLDIKKEEKSINGKKRKNCKKRGKRREKSNEEKKRENTYMVQITNTHIHMFRCRWLKIIFTFK